MNFSAFFPKSLMRLLSGSYSLPHFQQLLKPNMGIECPCPLIATKPAGALTAMFPAIWKAGGGPSAGGASAGGASAGGGPSAGAAAMTAAIAGPAASSAWSAASSSGSN